MTADADVARPAPRSIQPLGRGPISAVLECLGNGKGMTADADDARPAAREIQQNHWLSSKAGRWERDCEKNED